jgi:hypothetical protein
VKSEKIKGKLDTLVTLSFTLKKIMFLNLNHKSLTVYSKIRELTKEIYRISSLLPAEEKFNMIPQIRRAGLSVRLNFAEGSNGNQAWKGKDIMRFPGDLL